MPVELSLTIIALSSLVLTVFAVLLFWQVRKTAKAVKDTLNSFNAKAPAIMAKLEDILSDVKHSSVTVRSQVDMLTASVARIRELSDVLFACEKELRGVLETNLLKAARNVSAAKKGFSAFLTTLSNRKRIDCR